MGWIVEALVLTSIAASAAGNPTVFVSGTQAPASGVKSGVIKVCSLLPRAEVKKLLPWPSHVDGVTEEEEPIGTTGSSCSYPNVHVQVLPFSRRMIDYAREGSTLESVSGVGDEAHFRDNRKRYAELFVRVGSHMLTLQADVPAGRTSESLKPAVVALAKAYVEKLR